jgi:hypothetical protein
MNDHERAQMHEESNDGVAAGNSIAGVTMVVLILIGAVGIAFGARYGFF